MEHSVLLKPKFPYQTRSHSSASKCRKVSRQTPGGAEGLASGPQSAAIPYNARSSAIPNADRTAEERGGGKPASGVSGEFGVWESVGGTIFHFPGSELHNDHVTPALSLPVLREKKGVSDRAVFGIIARSKPRISRSVAQPFQWFHAPLSFENFAPAMRCQLRWLAFPPVFLATK